MQASFPRQVSANASVSSDQIALCKSCVSSAREMPGGKITHFFIRNGIHRNEEIIQGKNLQPASRSRVLRAGGLERFWALFSPSLAR